MADPQRRRGIFPLSQLTIPGYRVFYQDRALTIVFEELGGTRYRYIAHYSPAEYAILKGLLLQPFGETVAYQDLLPTGHESFLYKRDISSMMRHMARLKYKIPSTLRLVHVRGEGYTVHQRALTKAGHAPSSPP